ncbi:unnamed protein product [Camellia sinensis]
MCHGGPNPEGSYNEQVWLGPSSPPPANESYNEWDVFKNLDYQRIYDNMQKPARLAGEAVDDGDYSDDSVMGFVAADGRYV